jgi:hypothetical protein
MRVTQAHSHRRWTLADIAFDRIDIAAARSDDFLFTTLASASFVEILAQTYSANLIAHFAGDTEITEWLATHWQPEEVQHGEALKRYVTTVWPEFDWDGGHARFAADYAACCTIEQLEPQRALELIARCVVETGTSTFYRAIHDYTEEPVLRMLIERIKTDEAAHYTFFRRHFALLNDRKRHPARAVIATIWRRVREVRGEDAYIAFKHVHMTRHPSIPFTAAHWDAYNLRVKQLARRYYPYEMAIRMLVKPIPIMEAIKRPLCWCLVGAVRLASAG